MNKVIAALCLVFATGCTTAYHRAMDDLKMDMEATKARDYRARAAWRIATAQETDFISTLTNEQLVAYQNLSDVFATGNPAADQLARRGLVKCLDKDSYVKGVTILQDKHRARLEIDAVGRSYINLQQQVEQVDRLRQQQNRAIDDYLLRESIRSRNSYGPYSY